MHEQICRRISNELNIPEPQVRQTAALLDEGNTIPFVARYRKEMTGGLSDEAIRRLFERLLHYRNLEQKRLDVLRLIEAQGALTPELAARVEAAATVTELDDLYRPFRPKRRTRATAAREKGLEPLALAIMAGDCDARAAAEECVNPELGVPDAAAALQGAMDIIAEIVSDDAAVRKELRALFKGQGVIRAEKAETELHTYDDYAGYSEPAARIKPHRVLAINRGLKENALGLKIEIAEDACLGLIEKQLIKPGAAEPCRALLKASAADSYRRLIFPSLERETWSSLVEEAVAGAIGVFKENLKKRLLVPPVRQRRVMGWDPGFRTGCKLACVSETGALLAVATVYPTPPKNDREGAAAVVLRLLQEHRINCIAVGNGTASRESEQFIADLIKEHNLPLEYTIVNEAGASVYSASPLAGREFPALDVAERSAVSIARRLQDPLAELVKIDPKSIGVGQYQHDMPPKELEEALAGSVESCVNSVGVDLNTASAPLLSYVAGINKTVAERIVGYRGEKGSIKSRAELLAVPGLGPKVFRQCAGFLRLPESADYLERSAVHPESYDLGRRVMSELRIEPEHLGHPALIPDLTPAEIAGLAGRLGAGEPTLRDILDEFRKPGRDPREELPKPVFLKSVTGLEELKPGMVLMGIVRNIVDFGAFVDIGVHQDGLVHISEIADRYIKHPLEALQIEAVVPVKILSIDPVRHRISLSIKQAG